MRTHARSRARLIGATVMVLGLLVAPVSSWADTRGEVSVDNVRPQLGDQITVTGSGFNPGDRVSFRVCGAPDAAGRLACAEGNEELEVGFDGTVRGPLTVEEPSGPCPCSVVVDSPEGPPSSTPINLVGHDMAKAVKAPDLVVDSAVLTPEGGLGRWLGAAPELTLKMTLRNAGVAPAEPTLDVVWREGDDDSNPVTDAGLPIVEPGESVDVEVPLKFGALAHGEHTVSGQIVVGDLYSPVEAGTTLAPWGLYALVLGALGFGGYARARKVAAGHPKASASRSHSSDHKVEQKAPGRRASVPAARQSSTERVRESSTERVREPATERVREPASESSWQPAEIKEPAKSSIWGPEPVPEEDTPAPAAARRGRDVGTPAYVGPPRLESTPLAPRPGGSRVMTLQSQSVDADVEAPRVPHQTSAFAHQGTVAPAEPVVTRNTTPEQDAATVADAMAIIRERSGSAPAQLPGNYEAAPSGKRAERGGKRAARPEKPQRWITRR